MIESANRSRPPTEPVSAAARARSRCRSCASRGTSTAPAFARSPRRCAAACGRWVTTPCCRDRIDEPGRTNVVFGSNLIANLDAAERPRFAPGSILYNLEQIYEGSPWLTAELLAAFRAHTVWDYSAANIRALARMGVTAHHAPVGYVPALTRIPDAGAADIDVLFIGSIADRRLRVLQELERRGAKVMAVYGLYGPERDALIARSKNRPQHPLSRGQGVRGRARLVPAGQPPLRRLGDRLRPRRRARRSRAASPSRRTSAWPTPAWAT